MRKNITLILFPVLILIASACSKNSTNITDSTGDIVSPGAIPPQVTGNKWIDSCNSHPALCVLRCQRDALSCAKKINEYVIGGKKVNGLYRFQSWTRYSKQGLSPADLTLPGEANVLTPMHGAYLKTYVNDIAKNYIQQLQRSGTQVDRVDFPNGSIIAKQNAVASNMDPDKGPWMTVMFKLDGYCHAGFGDAGPCIGGEWFYYLYRFGDFKYFDNVPAFGKAQAFCVDCHGPVEKGDWLWTTTLNLNQVFKAKRPTVTVPRETAATSNVVRYCEDVNVSAVLPGDVAFDPGSVSPEKAQTMFDCLSWRSFVALNWPGDASKPGQPMGDNFVKAGGPRVWETYRSVFEVFQPEDPDWSLQDRQWDDPILFDPVCKAQTLNDKVLRMVGKSRDSSIVDETHQAFGNQFNQLVDQNRNITLFEVRLNRDEFEYLKDTGFADTGNYTVGGPKGQLSWQATPLQLPDNVRGSDSIAVAERVGAIELKASWRQMCTDAKSCNKVDVLSDYYVRDAVYYKRDPLGGEGRCEPLKVGLVGMHIAHKTFWSPQWVWSTFEHVDNVPEAGDLPASKGTKTRWSFYNPALAKQQPENSECMTQRPGVFPLQQGAKINYTACPNLQSIANSHPQDTNESKVKDKKKAEGQLIPNQVTRIDPITKSPLNAAFRNKLKSMGSPFANYQLVNTQWPLNGRGVPVETSINLYPCSGAPAKDCYTSVPMGLNLRNTTMETYQVTFARSTAHPSGQTSSGGCIQCHARAGIDFSFAWTDAIEEPVPLVSSKRQ